MTPPAQAAFFFDQLFLNGRWERNVRITISHGLIERILVDAEPLAADSRLKVGLPGMSNLHSHAFQRGMSGLTERRGIGDDSFWSWREVMYDFVDKVTPEDVEDIAALAYAEMLESGFTNVGEFHYLHHDRAGRPFANPAEMSLAIIQAALRSGIALTHLPVFYGHSDFGGMPPEAHQRRFTHSVDSYSRLLEEIRRNIVVHPDVNLGLAPHSLRAVTPSELSDLLCLAPGSLIHIHIAEQTKEVEGCLAWSGSRPVEWLMNNAPVDRSWCLVHATHLTDQEVSQIVASEATVGLCPITEANLGDGHFPASQFLKKGGTFGIGSDSNVQIDMTEELRLLEYGQRLLTRQRNILANGAGDSTGRNLYSHAVSGGARALGQPPPLTEGAPADFITLNMDHPTLSVGRQDSLLDRFLFGAGRSAIDGVWRRGTQIVFAGGHRDRRDLASRYRKTLRRLLT